MERHVFIRACFFSEGDVFEKKADGDTDRISSMCISSLKGLAQSRSAALPKDAPLFFGSAFSSLADLHAFNCVCENNGALAVNPRLFPRAVLNAPSCRAGIEMHITEPVYNIMSGEASEFYALKLAAAFVSCGNAENAIICTAEECCRIAAEVVGGPFTDRCGAIWLTASPTDWELHSVRSRPPDTEKTAPGMLTGELTRRICGLINAEQQGCAGHDVPEIVGSEAVYTAELIKRKPKASTFDNTSNI